MYRQSYRILFFAPLAHSRANCFCFRSRRVETHISLSPSLSTLAIDFDHLEKCRVPSCGTVRSGTLVNMLLLLCTLCAVCVRVRVCEVMTAQFYFFAAENFSFNFFFFYIFNGSMYLPHTHTHQIRMNHSSFFVCFHFI